MRNEQRWKGGIVLWIRAESGYGPRTRRNEGIAQFVDPFDQLEAEYEPVRPVRSGSVLNPNALKLFNGRPQKFERRVFIRNFSHPPSNLPSARTSVSSAGLTTENEPAFKVNCKGCTKTYYKN